MSNPEILNEVNRTINQLEQGLRRQNYIDSVYNEWCDIVKQTMYEDIPYKTVINGNCTRKHRPGKPWWTDNLSKLWSDMSLAERRWLSCNNRSDKVVLKSQYCRLRKQFDTEVQKAKRRHWYSIQEE